MIESIEVPVVWLRKLVERANLVSRQMKEASIEDNMVFFKTDIHALTGFGMSAEFMLPKKPNLKDPEELDRFNSYPDKFTNSKDASTETGYPYKN